MAKDIENPSSIGFRKLGANSVIYILGDVITRGSAFLLIPIYTRFLSPAEYGNWGVLLSLISLISIVFSFQLSSSLTMNYFQVGVDRHREIVTTLLMTTMFASAVFFIVFVVVGSGWIGSFFSGLTNSNYVLAMGICLFSAFVTIPQTLMRLRQKATASVFIISISYLLGIIAGLYLLIRFSLGITGLLAGTLFANALSAILYIFNVREDLIAKFSLKIAISSVIVSFPIILHMLSHWGLNLMDRLVLQMYLPLSEVGIYQLGYQLGAAFQMIVIAINSAWTPYFMQNFIEKKQHLNIKRYSTWLVFLLVWGALALMLLLPTMVRWIIPVEYEESVKVMPWIITGFLFVGLYQFWINIILYYKKTVVVPVITAISASLNLILNLLFVPRYGYIIAAVNTGVSYLLLACLSCLIARRVSSFSFDYYRWIKILIVGGVLFFAASLTSILWGEGFSLWTVIPALLAYPAVLWFVGFYNKDEKEYFQKFVGGIFT